MESMRSPPVGWPLPVLRGARAACNIGNIRGLPPLDSPATWRSYFAPIPIHRFPAAHSCARRFFVWMGLSKRRDGVDGARRPVELKKETNGTYCRGQHPHQQARRIALTYIHGIGRTTAKKITDKLGIAPKSAGPGPHRPGSAAHPRSDRPRPHGRGRPSPRDGDEHQAADGPRLLPRPSPPQGPSGPRPAHAHQCAHPQGQGQADRRARRSKRPSGDGRETPFLT